MWKKLYNQSFRLRCKNILAIRNSDTFDSYSYYNSTLSLTADLVNYNNNKNCCCSLNCYYKFLKECFKHYGFSIFALLKTNKMITSIKA